MSIIEVSVIIPVKNGMIWLKNSIPKFLNQKIEGGIEIIIIDSGSKDGIFSFIEQFSNVSIFAVNPEDFNHGKTRNLGVGKAKGKYVVFTVQDASPINEFWLQNLINGFNEFNVVAVCGLQAVPHEYDKNPLSWFRPITKQPFCITYIKALEFINMNIYERKTATSWDNVNACYLREILLEIPFKDVEFAEDAYWALDTLNSGKTICYNPNAIVYHYHHETFEYSYKRQLVEWYFDYKLHKIIPKLPPNVTLKLFIKWTYIFIKSKIYNPFEILFWIRYNSEINKANHSAFKIFNNFYQKNNLDALYANEIYKKIPIAKLK